MKLNAKHLLILQLIDTSPDREAYGLDLVRAAPKDLSMSSVFLQLSDLETANYISSRLTPATPPGLPRRKYHITTNGRRARIDQAAGVPNPGLGQSNS